VSDSRWLTADQERAWRAYRRMNRLLYSQLARDLTRETELSEPDYEVLSTLTEVEEHAWRATALAEHLQWSSSRLAHHIGRMEQRGLVSREACPEDGRGALIRLTGTGWQAIKAAAPLHVASVRHHFINRLTPTRLAALEEIATTILRHLDDSVSGDGDQAKKARRPAKRGRVMAGG
jgi:DNA-binding MarR family transcriptional regulator